MDGSCVDYSQVSVDQDFFDPRGRPLFKPGDPADSEDYEAYTGNEGVLMMCFCGHWCFTTAFITTCSGCFGFAFCCHQSVHSQEADCSRLCLSFFHPAFPWQALSWSKCQDGAARAAVRTHIATLLPNAARCCPCRRP